MYMCMCDVHVCMYAIRTQHTYVYTCTYVYTYMYIHMCTVHVLYVYRLIPHSSGNSYIRIIAFVDDHHVVVPLSIHTHTCYRWSSQCSIVIVMDTVKHEKYNSCTYNMYYMCIH